MKEENKKRIEEIFNKIKNEEFTLDDFKKACRPKQVFNNKNNKNKDDYKKGGKYYYYEKKPDSQAGNITWSLYNNEELIGEYKIRELVDKIKEIFDITIETKDVFKVASKFKAKSKKKQENLKEIYKGMRFIKN